jgi:hypothetical protein
MSGYSTRNRSQLKFFAYPSSNLANHLIVCTVCNTHRFNIHALPPICIKREYDQNVNVTQIIMILLHFVKNFCKLIFGKNFLFCNFYISSFTFSGCLFTHHHQSHTVSTLIHNSNAPTPTLRNPTTTHQQQNNNNYGYVCNQARYFARVFNLHQSY